MSESEKTWSFDGWADRYGEAFAADSLLYARYDEVLDTMEASTMTLLHSDVDWHAWF